MPASLMSMYRGSIVFFATFLCSILLSINPLSAQPDGKALFSSNCASCHNPIKDATGPALQGVSGRVPSKEWLHKWVRNSAALIASGDQEANAIFNKWGKIPMPPFPSLKDEEIDAIIAYVDDFKAPVPKVAATGTAGSDGGDAESNTWLYVVLTLGLLAVALVLWRVNRSLSRAAQEHSGQPVTKEIPIYRNKLAIAIGAIVLLCLGGYWITNGAVNMGRQQNYIPSQPIFYSHKVHAGINQINCLYCHAGAEKSKHAMIPSVNVCMNCHKQINEYTGVETHELVDFDGKKYDGTAEIAKLYDAAGWDPEKKDYRRDLNGNILAKPVEWVKIHNLPDHVYFNHSQHVSVGKVQCQQCHGAIEEMDEVFQSAPLSMGWCVNCHRQTEVKFQENSYYSIFEKYHQELKDGKREGVTVEDIGGIECQKCHY